MRKKPIPNAARKRNRRTRSKAAMRKALSAAMALSRLGAVMNDVRAINFTPPTFLQGGIRSSKPGEEMVIPSNP